MLFYFIIHKILALVTVAQFWFMSKILTSTAGKVAGELVGRQLWRVDRVNKFLEVPQCWVTSFDSPMGERREIIDLHPDIFRAFPRFDILAKNLRWQDLYRNVVRKGEIFAQFHTNFLLIFWSI